MTHGDSAFNRRHEGKNHFQDLIGGEFIPVGALVTFKPSPMSTDSQHKMDSRGVSGVFLRYVLQTGATYQGQMEVVALSEFVGKALHRHARALNRKVHVQTVEEVSLPNKN